jgi:tRNA dimethylallyltransferase
MISKKSSVENSRPKAVIICGPTGSGKSSLGMYLAERFDGNIISADSRQIYKRLDIGTAKPGRDERKKISHYLIDVADVTETFTAGKFAELATQAILETTKQNKIPFIVGGAGLYIEALTAGLFDGPEIDPAIRKRLECRAGDIGAPALHEELQRIDPESASRISPNDSVRIIRALEIYKASGKTMNQWQSEGQYTPLSLDYLWLGLSWPRKELYRRIDLRVDQMIRDGLLDEIESLLSDCLGKPIIDKGIVGYYEIINALEKKTSVDEAIGLVKQHSRNYAKRQLTWFNNRATVTWIDAAKGDFMEIAANLVSSHLSERP